MGGILVALATIIALCSWTSSERRKPSGCTLIFWAVGTYSLLWLSLAAVWQFSWKSVKVANNQLDRFDHDVRAVWSATTALEPVLSNAVVQLKSFEHSCMGWSWM